MDPPHAPTSCSGRYTCTHGSYSLASPAQKPCPNPCTPNTCLAVLIQVYSGGEYNLYEHAAINSGGGAHLERRQVLLGLFSKKKSEA